MHNFVLHMAAAVRRSRSGQVASGREPLPLLRTRRRAGQQVGAHPHRPRPVPARDRLQVLPHRGEEGRRFPETAPAECDEKRCCGWRRRRRERGANDDVPRGLASQLEFCGGPSLGAQNWVHAHTKCANNDTQSIYNLHIICNNPQIIDAKAQQSALGLCEVYQLLMQCVQCRIRLVQCIQCSPHSSLIAGDAMQSGCQQV